MHLANDKDDFIDKLYRIDMLIQAPFKPTRIGNIRPISKVTQYIQFNSMNTVTMLVDMMIAMLYCVMLCRLGSDVGQILDLLAIESP